MIEKINWDKYPLLPAIAQDFNTKEVLMLGWCNKQALDLSLKTGFVHYFSRSRQRIWKKGEQSGHTQKIHQILLDCDDDTLLFMVDQKGVACHTGRKTCFFKDCTNNTTTQDIEIEPSEVYDIVSELFDEIKHKQHLDPKKSYVAKLMQSNPNDMLKKIIEEAGEFALAVKDKDEKNIVYEGADLLFHSLVALAYSSISFEAIKKELKRRRGTSGIVEKRNRKST